MSRLACAKGNHQGAVRAVEPPVAGTADHRHKGTVERAVKAPMMMCASIVAKMGIGKFRIFVGGVR